MDRLQDKVAIVTGAAHGIGRATVELFAEQGAWVLAVDVDREAGEQVVSAICEQGGRARFAYCDVSSFDEVEHAVHEVIRDAGRVDVLVNNAAYLADWLDAEQATRGQWDRSYSVTLMGAANCMRSVLPGMVAHKGGSIINVSSVHGLRGARSSAAYTSMKHALIGLTRSAACDFGPKGIRVNAICPGPIRTRIAPPDGSELHQRQITKTMLSRTGEPREVAWAAVFLASDESSYITGTSLPVDGGWTAF